MTPDLSRRLGDALGTKYATLAEQRTVRDGIRDVDSWDDISPNIQALVEDIEARPDPWLSASGTSRSTIPDADDDESDDDFDDDEALRAAVDGDEFQAYWTRGKGLARWSTKPHPWRTLRRLLRKHPGIRDPEGLASHYFHVVFGYWPGHRKGDNPVGPG